MVICVKKAADIVDTTFMRYRRVDHSKDSTLAWYFLSYVLTLYFDDSFVTLQGTIHLSPYRTNEPGQKNPVYGDMKIVYSR